MVNNKGVAGMEVLYPSFIAELDSEIWQLVHKYSVFAKLLHVLLFLSDIYHEDVDNDGHWFGPNSKEVKQSIQKIDEDIDMLLDEINEHGLEDQVNLIVFSDHGMTSVDELNKIDISDAIDMDDIKTIADSSTQVFIWPHAGSEKKVLYFIVLYTPKNICFILYVVVKWVHVSKRYGPQQKTAFSFGPIWNTSTSDQFLNRLSNKFRYF